MLSKYEESKKTCFCFFSYIDSLWNLELSEGVKKWKQHVANRYPIWPRAEEKNSKRRKSRFFQA